MLNIFNSFDMLTYFDFCCFFTKLLGMYLSHTFKLVSALLKHRSYFLVASGILQKFTLPKELEFLLGSPKFSNNHNKMLSSGDLGVFHMLLQLFLP